MGDSRMANESVDQQQMTMSDALTLKSEGKSKPYSAGKFMGEEHPLAVGTP